MAVRVSQARQLLAAGGKYVELVTIGGIFIAVLLLAGLVVLLLRRRLRDGQPAACHEPFTLEHLRTLHRQGQLSDEEFERAKARMIQHMGAGKADEVDNQSGQAGTSSS